MNLSIILDIFREQVTIDDVVVIGGGAKGGIWREIMADIYDAGIVKPNFLEEATSMGAAIIGGVGAGVFKDFNVIDRFIKIESSQKPNPERQKVYRKLKPIFEKCYHSLVDVYEDLAEL